jgi:ATP-binding cassette, subfamily C, bacterial LapB
MSSDLRTVVKAVPKRSWNRFEIFLQSVAINLFAIALPIFILQVFNRVLPLGAANSLYVLVIGLVIVIIFDNILKTARTRIISWNGAQFEHLARMTAVDKILRCPYELFETESAGSYLEKVNSIGSVKEFYSNQIASLMIDLPFALLFLTLVFLLGGQLVAVPIILICVFGILAMLVGGRLRRAVGNRVSTDDSRYDFLLEVLNGIHTVKAMNLKPTMMRRFERLQERTAQAVRGVAMESAIAQGLGSLFSQFNIVSVIAFGGYLVVQGDLTAGKLAACMLLSGRALQPMLSAMSIWTSYQTVKVASAKAAEIMRLPEECPRDMPEIPPISGAVQIRDLNFAYGNAPEPFIKNVNLDVEAGEIISLEGANSSGRTTLMFLILGLLRPQSGKIMLDGMNIFDYDLRSVRGEISMISHNAPLYSGNLIDNMTGYQKGIVIDRALELSEALGLDQEIKNLPEGFDTQVGGSTVERIPGGVRQRIAIVRALVDDPKLILFDEGNLSLDAKSDDLLRKLLLKLKGKATMILVSSRPEIQALANRHFIMVEGELRQKLRD